MNKQPNNIKIKKLIQLHEKSWSRGYHFIPKIINKYKVKTGAEIGVAFGGHSESILNKTKIKKLYGIDPYKHIKLYSDPMNLDQDLFDDLYLYTLNRLKPFKRRYVHIRKPSILGVKDIKRKLDFVYIDADHSYEGCLEDILTWVPLVKNRGIISGHDYYSQAFPGVTKAVNWLAQTIRTKVVHLGYGYWYAIKPKYSIKIKNRLNRQLQIIKIQKKIKYYLNILRLFS